MAFFKMNFFKKKSNINKLFEKVYVITLKTGFERDLISFYFKKYNIKFEFVEGINGSESEEINNHYLDYLSWSFDDPRTHPLEKIYRKKLVRSAGAFGLLFTYKKLLELLIKNKYDNVLILDDDVLFDKEIDLKIKLALNKIKNYDILYLGASQHVWKNPKIFQIDNKTGYYMAPFVIDGSFAVAYNRKVYQKLLDLINKKNAPIDLLLRDITKEKNSYVIYPNIAIAETTKNSKTILESRNLRFHSENVKWNLSDIDFSRSVLKVSVLVASHNNKDTIENCINSALNQSYKNIEIVVVDDCSTDGSYEILKKYKEKIKLIRLEKNSGAYKCRNVALENSTGFFITLLDADDVMMSTKIENDVYNYYNNNNCEMFFSNIYRSQKINKIKKINDNYLQKIINKERKPFLRNKEEEIKWDYRYRFGMQTIFVEKYFFEKYGMWRDDFRYGMDIDLVQRYIAKKYNEFIDKNNLSKILYKYEAENYGIFVSKKMNYFSYPMNTQNATIICQGNEREKIHSITQNDIINTLRSKKLESNQFKSWKTDGIEAILTICNVHFFGDREVELLKHFIQHYKSIKTKIIFCCSKENTKFIEYCENNNLICKKFNNFIKNSTYGQQDANRINIVKNEYNKWYIPVDLDEFIEIPKEFNSIYDLRQLCILNEKKYAMGALVDRFVEKNKIKEKINSDELIEKQFPYKEKFTSKIMKGYATKVVLCSPDLNIAHGHHFVEKDKELKLCLNKQNLINVNHYKWFGDIMNLEKEKMKIRKLVNNSCFKEQQRLFKHFNFNEE